MLVKKMNKVTFIVKMLEENVTNSNPSLSFVEHWRASLIAMFDDVTKDLELTSERAETGRKRKRERLEKAAQAVKWSVPYHSS
jgi:hypothetical protein